MDRPITLPKQKKWKRASRPKSRTGCLTWFRHLKCDEEKPTCHRCRNDHVKCDGYAAPAKKQGQKDGSETVAETAPIAFNPRVADTSIERYYFHHFYHWTSTQLTCSLRASNLYLAYVLPLAHTCEPIKHAVIAVGAAYRYYMTEPLAKTKTYSPLSQSYILALQQYNKAIAKVKSHMCSNPADVQCTLICCLLFVAFEGITGRYTESIGHIRAGTRLLSSAALNNSKERKMLRKLTEMFSNLGVEASIFMEDAIIPDQRTGCVGILSGLDTIDQPFPDLDEAACLLRKLDVSAIDIMAQLYWPDTSCKTRPSTKAEFDIMWDEIDGKFEAWSSRFELTKNLIAISGYEVLQSTQLIYLTLQHRFRRLCMAWKPEEGREPSHDTVESFLDVAELFAERILTPGQPSFSLDGELICSLSLTIQICSARNLQSRALNLLRSLNRREGIWDSREITEMHEVTLALKYYKT